MFICRSDRTNRRNGVVLSLLLPVLVSSVFLATGAPYLAHYQSHHTSMKVGRTLLWDKRIIDPDDKLYVAGYIIGVVSAGFYVIARVPQIIKNVSLFSLFLSLSFSLSWCPIYTKIGNYACIQFMRCSVEGLSVYMFILSVLGNVTYGLGILLYSVDGIFLLQKLPWLVGSLGTMVFDIIVSFLINYFLLMQL